MFTKISYIKLIDKPILTNTVPILMNTVPVLTNKIHTNKEMCINTGCTIICLTARK
jgi:hypothetical protein